MKSLLFWCLLLVLFIVYGYTYSIEEPFAVQYPTNFKVPEINPQREVITTGDFKAFSPPAATLLSAPPGGIASIGTKPYKDPAFEKASLSRIANLLETAKGFLQTEASTLADSSDPMLQLPVITLKSDIQRLNDDYLVLKRNPSLESTLTQGDLDEMEANLTYLQKVWRSKPYVEEGFAGGYWYKSREETKSSVTPLTTAQAVAEYKNSIKVDRKAIDIQLGTSNSRTATTTATKNTKNTNKKLTATQLAIAAAAGTGAAFDRDASGNKPRVSLPDPRANAADLTELKQKINIELARLTASGATDESTQSRIKTLTDIKKSVQDILDKIAAKTMKEKDIPMTKKDIQEFLPTLNNSKTPINNFIKSNNLPESLNSLFSSYSIGDASGSQLNAYLFDKYADTFFKGLSWDVRLNYTAERAKQASDKKHKAEKFLEESVFDKVGPSHHAGITDSRDGAPVDDTRGVRRNVPAARDNASAGARDNASAGTRDNASAGARDNATVRTRNNASAGANAKTPAEQDAANYGNRITVKPSEASHFDWKSRSEEICSAIKKRGYEPGDFGCMKPGDTVSKTFSYRGYSKMICNRLSTLYDIGGPEACGCPPAGWQGWR